eukprot:242447-Hanusia_phi.AAC.4
MLQPYPSLSSYQLGPVSQAEPLASGNHISKLLPRNTEMLGESGKNGCKVDISRKTMQSNMIVGEKRRGEEWRGEERGGEEERGDERSAVE